MFFFSASTASSSRPPRISVSPSPYQARSIFAIQLQSAAKAAFRVGEVVAAFVDEAEVEPGLSVLRPALDKQDELFDRRHRVAGLDEEVA